MIAGLSILTSCTKKTNESGFFDSVFSSDVPKCEDEDVKNTVISILIENRIKLGLNSEWIEESMLTGNGKLKNILTKSINEELKSCNCEGTYTQEIEAQGVKGLLLGNIIYTAQKNSEGEIIVNIEETGIFETK